MNEHSYIACDLGAGSGRVILGRLRDGKISLEEVHRFVSPPVNLCGTLRWNIIQIFEELKIGLRKVAAAGETPASVSVDSWGVDYVLLNKQQPMLGLPYNYRDARTDAPFAAAMEEPGPALIFEETGIQFMPLNTLYQLIADVEQNRDLLEVADRFLHIADYVNFLFCGVGKVEESLASTTQMYNPRTRSWSKKLMTACKLPERIFPEIVPSGTRLGTFLPQLQEETGLGKIEVIATCSHDTGAAVAAIPAAEKDWAFLSSGTWSLMGVELPQPLINEEARRHDFTNEAGYGGTTRFLKNMNGMWIIAECRRAWLAKGIDRDFAELVRLAGIEEPLRSLINPNAARFSKPDDMPAKIRRYCEETGQPVPESQGQIARCILESLALLYRKTIDELRALTGRDVRTLHIVGGGSQNTLLNQFAANATNCQVIAGPVEATAAGNVLIQAITLGHVASLQNARELVRASFSVQEFQPQRSAEWQQAYERFSKLDLTT